MTISMENLYVDSGAYRVNVTILDFVLFSHYFPLSVVLLCMKIFYNRIEPYLNELQY